ncbi:PREDICTED: phosphoinositide 3-kinase adapter protein 1-like [Fulmarus glacialis]|uniref:phosphoinositide 3-kinase adapter protein 1-like n=1 Tax=Fulmarus glacialis TaxID=30455 RepID=UPI00051B25FB|nr:PREDICTED: phosphoinositide 3-kinase adapter protein 1-like [Fulmarus glacialis]
MIGLLRSEHQGWRTPGGYDVLIVYASDAAEWCQYLQNLFLFTRHVRKHRILSYQLEGESAISHQELDLFSRSRSIILLLSAELVQSFYLPPVLQSLQEALWPPYKVVKLFCGVTDCDEYLTLFKDWSQWQELTNDDEPDAYLAAVKKAISEGKVAAMELCFLVRCWRREIHDIVYPYFNTGNVFY